MNNVVKYIKYAIFGLLAFMGGLSVTSCKNNSLGESFNTDASPTILAYLQSRATPSEVGSVAEYSTFLKILDAANRANSLGAYNPRNKNGYTVFAPTNAAFSQFFASDAAHNSLEALIADASFLKKFVDYHIVNGKILSKDFTYGTLSDSTIAGDYVTIVFSNDFENNSVTYLVNGKSKVVQRDIDLSNGVVHGIDKVLEPSFYSALELINPERNPDLSIFYEALTKTGVSKLLGPTKVVNGQLLKNNFTLLVEPDSILKKAGINSYADLVAKYSTSADVTDPLNGLYQEMAYHVISGVYYLNNFNQSLDDATGKISSSLYNTFSYFPLSVLSDLQIQVNPGGRVLETIYQGPNNRDTIKIDYAEIDYLNSNQLSTNGPVHFLKNILEIEASSTGQFDMHFLDDEPNLVSYYNSNKTNYGQEKLFYPKDLYQISFTGIDYIYYGLDDVFWDKDYIKVLGDFTLDIKTPKLAPGKYTIFTRYAEGNGYASVQVFFNGQRVGNIKDCSRVTGSNGQPSSTTLGDVIVTKFGQQKITIDAISPGYFKCYFIRFTPKL